MSEGFWDRLWKHSRLRIDLQPELPDFEVPAQDESPKWAGTFDLRYSPQALFTDSEFAFFKVLRAAIPETYLICPKVRIADIVKYAGSDNAYGGLMRVARKHVDFLIVRESDGWCIAAIELDSHHHAWKPSVINRDLFVNEVFRTADVPLIRLPVGQHRTVADVRAYLRDAYRRWRSGKPPPTSAVP